MFSALGDFNLFSVKIRQMHPNLVNEIAVFFIIVHSIFYHESFSRNQYRILYSLEVF